MVITSSDVAMGSGRTYQRQTRDRSSVQTWGEVLGATTSPRAQDSRTVTQSETNLEAVQMYQNYSSGGRLIAFMSDESLQVEAKSQVKTEVSRAEESEMKGEYLAVKNQVAGVMFTRIFTGNDADLGTSTAMPLTLRDFFSLLIRQRQEEFSRFMDNFRIGMRAGGTVTAQIVTISVDGSSESGIMMGSGKRVSVNVTKSESRFTEYERESTRVATTGKVKTADGREIDFDVNLNLDRSFKSVSESMTENKSVRLTDPLVINFGTGSAELEDQTFSFDIDCDGELDNIAILGQACGYLALDLNEDGIINDGSELFGTKSGDGFADLAVYDVDGNGWIDENDPIFDKLKIWSKDAAGNDQLVGLGVRGIGAIFLGHTPSEFSIRDGDNDTLGVIRSSGIFLREDGSAGTVQQVDLAKRSA